MRASDRGGPAGRPKRERKHPFVCGRRAARHRHDAARPSGTRRHCAPRRRSCHRPCGTVPGGGRRKSRPAANAPAPTRVRNRPPARNPAESHCAFRLRRIRIRASGIRSAPAASLVFAAWRSRGPPAISYSRTDRTNEQLPHHTLRAPHGAQPGAGRVLRRRRARAVQHHRIGFRPGDGRRPRQRGQPRHGAGAAATGSPGPTRPARPRRARSASAPAPAAASASATARWRRWTR